MADSSTANSKHELRQKLESMKKAYAQTLRKVQKSEKANRTRSHVQRVLAEQGQVTSNDASPSCTHRLSRRICADGDATKRFETLSPSETGVKDVEVVEAVDTHEGSMSTVAMKRLQRKCRSVSFSIPKESSSMRTPSGNTKVEVTGDLLRSSKEVQAEPQTKKRAAEICQDGGEVVQALSPLAQSDELGGGLSAIDEKVTLVVPESQFLDSLDGSLNDRICTPTTAAPSQQVPGQYCDQENVIHSGKGIQKSAQSDSRTQKAIAQDLKETRQTDQLNPVSVQSLSGGNIKTRCKNDPEGSPSLCQSSTKVRTRRANRKSRRRPRVPRELTASDISFKEVVESQSTEEGSHTWIEGLMYPVEYYVRRTRSMTSSQCPQSQNNLNGVDHQRYLDSDPTLNAMRKDSFKESLSPETAALTSGIHSWTESSLSVPKTDSDSMKSQLSQSLLNAYPGQAVQESRDRNTSDVVKLFKKAKTQRLQRKRGPTSAAQTDTKTKSDTLKDSVCELSAGSYGGLFPTVTNVELLQTEFALPEEDYGGLKLVKLQSNTSSLISEAQPEGTPDHLGKSHSAHSVPKIKDVRTDLLVSQQNKASIRLASPGSINENKLEENDTSKVTAASKEVPESGTSRHEEFATTGDNNLGKGSSSRCSKDVGSELTERQTVKPLSRNVLESQLSPTQLQRDCRMALPDPGCTPGWSPTCSLEGEHETTGPAGRLPPSSDKGTSPRCHNQDEHQGPISHKRNTYSTNSDSKCHNSPLSGPRSSSSRLPNASPPQSFKINNQSSSHGDVRQSSVSSPSILPGFSSPSTSKLGAADQNPKTERSTGETNPGDDSVTPPNVIQHIPVNPRGNIKHTSPFAGGATGTPPGRAETPKAMSQCEVRVSSGEGDGTSDEAKESSTQELALAGCLQHDLPWEASPTVRDVTGGRMHRDGQDISLLTVLYEHTLVIWWTNSDIEEWQILKSWVLPEEEEFLCIRLMPCSRCNTVSLVVVGVFATCSIRILNYDAATEETQQMDVNLAPSCERSVPYLLCPTGDGEFAVAVKDDTGSALFVIHASSESRNVQTWRLWTGKETNLTSLLQVEGAEGMLMATTVHNEFMLWNCKTGELIKDKPMKLTDSGRHASCLKAVVEAGLLFLIVIYRDDVSEQEEQCSKAFGAAVVVNPLTNKMATLVEYQPAVEHTYASLVDAVIHQHSLLAKLSDGSLHQWNIFSGNLMNYSSPQPANHSLRSAHLCRSEVVLLGTDQCQQVYSAN